MRLTRGKSATIGGNVMTNAGGMRAVKTWRDPRDVLGLGCFTNGRLSWKISKRKTARLSLEGFNVRDPGIRKIIKTFQT